MAGKSFFDGLKAAAQKTASAKETNLAPINPGKQIIRL